MRYELSNISDHPMREIVHLTITVESEYSEAVQLLDAARYAWADIEADRIDPILEALKAAVGR